MISALSRARGRTHLRLTAWLIAIACLGATAIPVLVITAEPAAAAAASADQVPRCPPDCGAVAAGDPLLVGFMTVNPGDGWLAVPAAETQSYVSSLRRNASRLGGRSTTTNVAAARWEYVTHRYSLLITLVSSTSLAKVRLQSPVSDAADLCSSAGGTPTGSPSRISGIPGSASGSCAFPSNSSVQGAAVAAFIRSNVAVLVEVSSRSNKTSTPSSPFLPYTNNTQPSPQAESPFRAGASMSNGSSSGSSSWPLLPSASFGAPAEEGAGEDPFSRSPKLCGAGKWPSGCPSSRWSAPWPSQCSIRPSCAGSVRGGASSHSVISGRTGPMRPTRPLPAAMGTSTCSTGRSRRLRPCR